MVQRVQEGRRRDVPAEPTAAEPVAPSADPVVERPPRPEIKHCWVSDEHGRLPGLLLEWRRAESGYRGRVVRPVLDEELGWIVVEEWLPADLLAPA